MAPPKSDIPPLVFEPKGLHKTTLIVLHGRGSKAEKFAEPLLTSLSHAFSHTHTTAEDKSPQHLKDKETFRDFFPSTKFIFPTAPLRRAKVFNRALIHQWFDNWRQTQPEFKQHLQIPGLRETSTYLHGLLQQEIDIVGASNVVLAGLSQGCASSLVATLLWEGESFGAVVGMCGYLPFRKRMCEVVKDREGDDEDRPIASSQDGAGDLFQRSENEVERESKFDKAVGWLREELDVEGRVRAGPPSIQSIPIFIGHGTKDEKVPFEQGKLAAELLRAVDLDVEFKGYEGLGHWYSDDMLRHIAAFLKKRKGWEDSIPASTSANSKPEDQQEDEQGPEGNNKTSEQIEDQSIVS